MYKIELKNDWDTPLSPPHMPKAGRFCGRLAEVEAVKNFISRRDSASILLIGHRGVGKTTLLRHILRELQEDENCSKVILPVFINGPQLFYKNGTDVESKHLLRILITRLYKSIDASGRDVFKKVRGVTENLYKKATASDYKAITDSVDQKSMQNEKFYEAILSFSVPDVVKFMMMVFVSITTILSVFSNNQIGIVSQVLLSLVAIAVPGVIAFNSKSVSTNKATEVKEEKAQNYYFFDNNEFNLEHDLEELHENYSKAGIKIVYVFDELDKIPIASLKKLVSGFKNFFTLSYANFIFSTNEEIADVLPVIGSKKREPDYTYFNVNFFLSRPRANDLHVFLDDIIQEVSPADHSVAQNFKNHLIFKSKSDFFDLIRVIQNHSNDYSKNGPLITYSENYEKKISINSRLQEAINLVFEKKYESFHKEKWKQNEEILNGLYDFSHLILGSNGVEVIFSASEGDVEVVYAAKRDLGVFLNRLNYLTSLGDVIKVISGKQVKVNQFKPSGDFTNEIPQELQFLSQWEEEFLFFCDEHLQELGSLFKLLNSCNPELKLPVLDEQIVATIDKFSAKLTPIGLNGDLLKSKYRIYEALKKEIPDTFKNEVVASEHSSLEIENNRIKSSAHLFISHVLIRKLNTFRSGCGQIVVSDQNWKSVLPNFNEDFVNRVSNQRNTVIHDRLKRKFVFILNLNDENILYGFKEVVVEQPNVKTEFKLIVLLNGYFDLSLSQKFTNTTFKTVEEYMRSIFEWYNVVDG